MRVELWEGVWTRAVRSVCLCLRETSLIQKKSEEQEQEAEHHLLEATPTPPAVSLSRFTLNHFKKPAASEGCVSLLL